MRDKASTRRSLLKGGALLAAPLATVAGTAAMAADRQATRLAQLEDQTAIRELHQSWLAAQTPPVQLAGPEAVEIAADGRSAAGRYPCTVEIQTLLPQDCTLAQMAHVQGGGVIRRAESRVLEVEYIKAKTAWAIAKVEFTPV